METTVIDLGICDYMKTLEFQHRLIEQRASGEIGDTLILVEHPHVFTVGRGETGDVPDRINGVPVYRVERGGKWTYHGPGQLVGYPIVNLDERGRDIRFYLRNLEQLLIGALRPFEILAERHEGHTGVWVGQKKIASIGVAVRKWVAFHGFALNVNTQLEYFRMIVPCGLRAESITSMKELLSDEVSMEAVKRNVLNEFANAFQTTLVEGAETQPIQA